MNIFNINEGIAKEMCAKGEYWLKCNHCGKEARISEEEFAKYLREGWPRCCDYTMTLENRTEAA